MDKHFEYAPDYTVAPGDILEETLEARGMKKNEFAERCGRTPKMISEIIAGKAVITPETALQFERVLGISAKLWTNLETNYRLRLAEQEEKIKLNKHQAVSKLFPIKQLAKYRLIDMPNGEVDALSKLLRFFGVGEVNAISYWPDLEISYYRHSKSYESNKFALASWLRGGQVLAENIQTKPYDQETFKNTLLHIRTLTKSNDIQETFSTCRKLLADCGVAFVFLPELEGTKLCGAARWLNKDKALVQLSARHKSDDHLWFTFFHECAHVLLHPKKELFIDATDQDKDELEKEADIFAQNFIIPKEDWKDFTTSSTYSDAEIKDFADKQGISAGLVVGRLQYHKEISFSSSKHNALKKFYELDEGKLLPIEKR